MRALTRGVQIHPGTATRILRLPPFAAFLCFGQVTLTPQAGTPTIYERGVMSAGAMSAGNTRTL